MRGSTIARFDCPCSDLDVASNRLGGVVMAVSAKKTEMLMKWFYKDGFSEKEILQVDKSLIPEELHALLHNPKNLEKYSKYVIH